MSIPVFFTGPILLLVFVYQLKWLPDVHYVGITEDPVQWFKSLILPWISLALPASRRCTRGSPAPT